MILKANIGLLTRHLMSTAMRAPEDGGGAAAPGAGEGDGGIAADGGDKGGSPESVLFPKEGDKPAAGDKPGEGDGSGAGNKGAADWKEYVPDSTKSDADNAAAKAEHDKTKPAEKKDDKSDADKVPEDGKYQLTMPEGIEVDQAMVDALGPEFKELGLTNSQAQKLADKFIDVQKQRVGKQSETWANTIAGWADQAKADKEIGGDKWDGTVKTALRAVDRLGTPALKDYLETTGGGNHPEMIRFMSKVGAMIREDSPPVGGVGDAGKPADPAHTIFPNDIPK